MSSAEQWFQKNKAYCKFSATEIMNFIRVDEPKVINYLAHPPVLGPKVMPPQVIDKTKALNFSKACTIYDVKPSNKTLPERKEKQNTVPCNYALPIRPEVLRKYISPNQAFNIAVRKVNQKHMEQAMGVKELRYYKGMIDKALK